MDNITRLDTIADVHRAHQLPGPTHPLITILDASNGHLKLCSLPERYVLNFYKITFITKLGGKIKYGQGYYDFDEGSMLFAAPNQIMGSSANYGDNEGYSLLIHPDFFLGYPLAKKIKQFCFFSYAANEALHLSEQEKSTIISIYTIIRNELNSRIDDFSHDVIIAQIELLLNYARRFYKRQFLTRKVVTNDLLQQLEDLLDKHFNSKLATLQGIPTVQYIAEQLNYTPNYLSGMLRSLTGLNAQQHIHLRLIEKSKELLSTTDQTVSEVAFQLGFEHPQSFTRLFKSKTRMSPVQFRASFSDN
ncbi:helix-turn-helix transcriptional regulator [Pedobacter aquatilis]|uniref:helix-turn-helix domain-containing protein n=1 Tax=Pedobacter aquatilis TaxID=351343 RepID=UPI00292F8286|nr:helix-turn-helix transcriptional regulator [Pedobacter aquatilis]